MAEGVWTYQPVTMVSTTIQNISEKVWTDYFVAYNLHPHHHLYFVNCINNIVLYIKTTETDYSRNK